jgi:hypothetical protein
MDIALPVSMVLPLSDHVSHNPHHNRCRMLA